MDRPAWQIEEKRPVELAAMTQRPVSMVISVRGVTVAMPALATMMLTLLWRWATPLIHRLYLGVVAHVERPGIGPLQTGRHP